VSTIKSREIAIRPETIQIERVPGANPEMYHFEGNIVSNVPRGNVLRYQIKTQGVNLEADVLFRSFALYENGEKVYISIPKKDCLELA
jgi:putative spermidine/putrescine transport system ATP-binding protein